MTEQGILLDHDEAHIVARSIATSLAVMERRPPRWPARDDREALRRLLLRLAPDARREMPLLIYGR